MQISNNFNRFFFGVVIKELKNLPPLEFEFMGKNCKVNFRALKASSIYQLLKQINKHYPIDENFTKLSTKDITSGQMSQHIQWIERLVSFNGYTFDYVAEEWERILNGSR